MSKKGGRRSLPANWLPQGTTYSMDEVDLGYSPRASGSRANLKSEKTPKQNRSKKPEKQSPNKVEVRILKRSPDKSMHVCEIQPVCSI